MIQYIALLRAVNVGGTGKLPMADLRAMCTEIGFEGVRTYIASGNVVFASNESPGSVKAALESKLLDYAGKSVQVHIRTASELREVLAQNPFADKEPKYTVAIFLDEAPPSDTLDTLTGQKEEEICLGSREIYVYYNNGMGRSKLKIPAVKTGTARNVNTITKLVEMASDT